MIQNQLECHLKKFCFNNGCELINKSLTDWATKRGIEIQTSSPHSLQQNGIAECPNHMLIELTWAMLITHDLPYSLWAEAASYAAYVRNCSPTTAVDGKTPLKAWTGTKPDISHLCEFGCDIHIFDEGDQLKLVPKANKYVFLGFEDSPHVVQYYNPRMHCILVS